MDRWNRLSHRLTHHVGTKGFFAVALGLAVIWLVDGLLLGAGRVWELTVTGGVPIVTLLLVVILQHAQNRDNKATQLKLNELLLALEAPDSKLIHADRLGDEDLQALDDHYDAQS